MANQILHGCFESIEPYNKSFKKVTVKTFAFGKNANFSNITPQSFELARNSIYSIPLVAKYIEDKTDNYGLDGDLSGHNSKIRKNSDGSWEIYQDTVPLGCVPNDAEIYFEDINEGTEESPDIKTYIVAKGCLLWMRYEAAQKIEEWLNNGIKPKVSMEIGEIQGELVDNYFTVNNFQFEAICALGSDKTPCFPQADISNYTKENFEKSYTDMLKELKELTQLELNQQNQNPLHSPTPDNVDLPNIDFQKENLQTKGGTNNLDEKLNLVTKYSNLTEEDITDLKTNADNYSLDEFDAELKKISDGKFEMTSEQLRTALRQSLSEKTEIKNDYWGDPYQSQLYYFADIITNSIVIVIDNSWENYFGIPFTISGDTVVLDYENKIAYLSDWRVKETGSSEFSTIKDIITEQIKFSIEKAESKIKALFNVIESEEYIDLQSKFSILEIEKNDLQSKFETLESDKSTLETKCSEFEAENADLKVFKESTITTQRTESENALFELFSEKLTVEELQPFKDTAKDFTIEQIKEKLYAFVGQKTTVFEHTQKPKLNVVFDRNNIEIKTNKPYDDILSKYAVKE